MTSSHSPVEPPKVAAFCVELFAAPHEADGILGDLEEEFRTEVERYGEGMARRHYWRQARRTVRDLAIAPWWKVMAFGLIGFALSWPVAWSLNAGAGGLVVNYPVYAYVPAVIFWSAISYSGPLTTGIIVALLARLAGLRPMSVAVGILAVMMVVFAIDVPIMTWLFGPPLGRVPLTFTALAIRWAAGSAMFGGLLIAGAVIGRTLPLPGRLRRRAS
jgi:hypothetical protein